MITSKRLVAKPIRTYLLLDFALGLNQGGSIFKGVYKITLIFWSLNTFNQQPISLMLQIQKLSFSFYEDFADR